MGYRVKLFESSKLADLEAKVNDFLAELEVGRYGVTDIRTGRITEESGQVKHAAQILYRTDNPASSAISTLRDTTAAFAELIQLAADQLGNGE